MVEKLGFKRGIAIMSTLISIDSSVKTPQSEKKESKGVSSDGKKVAAKTFPTKV